MKETKTSIVYCSKPESFERSWNTFPSPKRNKIDNFLTKQFDDLNLVFQSSLFNKTFSSYPPKEKEIIQWRALIWVCCRERGILEFWWRYTTEYTGAPSFSEWLEGHVGNETITEVLHFASLYGVPIRNLFNIVKATVQFLWQSMNPQMLSQWDRAFSKKSEDDRPGFELLHALLVVLQEEYRYLQLASVTAVILLNATSQYTAHVYTWYTQDDAKTCNMQGIRSSFQNLIFRISKPKQAVRNVGEMLLDGARIWCLQHCMQRPCEHFVVRPFGRMPFLLWNLGFKPMDDKKQRIEDVPDEDEKAFYNYSRLLSDSRYVSPFVSKTVPKVVSPVVPTVVSTVASETLERPKIERKPILVQQLKPLYHKFSYHEECM